MKKSKGKVVDFSDLDQENKTQFFDFLLKNNITFEEGQHNFVAKVSIKRENEEKRKSLSQRKTISTATPKQKVKANKENIYREIKTPNKKSSNQILLKNKSTPVKEIVNQNNSHRSKTKSQRSFINNTKSKSDKKKVQSKKIVQTAQFQPSIRSISKGKNKKINLKREDKSEVKKINTELKKKIHDEKEIFQLVAKYLKIFNLKLQGQRAIKWSVHQLLKCIQDIYDETFSKNTQILQNKNNIIKKGCNIFIKCVKDHFITKFRSQKLGNSNLMNMLHSLAVYIEKFKNCGYKILKNDRHMVGLQIFEDFIFQVYEPDDLLFFLFARSMLKKEFKIMNRNRSIEDEQILLNVRQISKFLICIVGKDSQLIQDYKDMILTKIDSQKITEYEFLRILIEDYRAKRLLSLEEDHILFKDPTLRNLDNSVNELTFGEDTQQKIQIFNDCELQFWNCQRLNTKIFQDEIQNLIFEKMKKKVSEFVLIILSNESQYNSLQTQGQKRQSKRQTIQKLLISKSLILLNTILEMNKIKWFQQLLIKDPSQEDIEFVEKLQMSLRSLKKIPDAKGIGEFCKSILTVSQLTEALEKLLL